MPKVNELRRIALDEDGVHDASYDAAAACFLVTFFENAFFKEVSKDSLPDSAINLSKLLKTFEHAVKQSLARKFEGQAPESDVQDVLNVNKYIQDRCHENVGAFDHIQFYLHASKANCTYSFPLKRIFYCIFNLLLDDSNQYFQTAESQKKIKQQERIYHLYLLIKGLYEYDRSLGGSAERWRICHTGVRHTLMDALQFFTLYIPRHHEQPHTIAFPIRGIPLFIQNRMSDYFKKYMNDCRSIDPNRWFR